MNGKILIVDDCVDLLEVINKILQDYDYEVHLTSSGIEALDKLSIGNYDCVLCDIDMPLMDGFELLERIIYTINSAIPVILMTGNSITVEDTLRAINLGVADFIKKPFTESQLCKAISKQASKTHYSDLRYINRKHLMSSCYCFVFKAEDFVNLDIADYLVKNIIKTKEICCSIGNELYLLLEEIISNSFIHGIFNLGTKYRNLNPQQYNILLKNMLKEDCIKQKTVSAQIVIDKAENRISITVTDQGDGFEFDKYLDNLRCLDSQSTDITGVFKGLNLISILADKVSFSNKGRTIIVEKNIQK